MNHHYNDIRERIDERPKWWDEYAVPRYCHFSPRHIANIYADECCLLLIACQGCATEFPVCMSRTRHETHESARTLGAIVTDGDIHYGDPPNIGCCAAGPTMNSVPLRVLEFWKNEGGWHRVPDLEILAEGMTEPELFFNGVRVSEDEFNKLIAESHDELRSASRQVMHEYSVSSDTADAICYLRTRSRWTQEKEQELIRRDQQGDPIPLSRVLSGEF